MTNRYDQWLDREKKGNAQAWARGYTFGFLQGVLGGLLIAGAAFAIGVWLV